MASKLQDEIKQGKPFASVQQELMLNLTRTASCLSHAMEQRLRPFGLSTTQYNVLRILRGAGPQGLCQSEIGARLVAQVPDVPRILERMEKAGWVRRVRGTDDRRVMLVSLTPAGLNLVGELDKPLMEGMGGTFQGLSLDEMRMLNELLEKARE